MKKTITALAFTTCLLNTSHSTAMEQNKTGVIEFKKDNHGYAIIAENKKDIDRNFLSTQIMGNYTNKTKELMKTMTLTDIRNAVSEKMELFPVASHQQIILIKSDGKEFALFPFAEGDFDLATQTKQTKLRLMQQNESYFLNDLDGCIVKFTPNYQSSIDYNGTQYPLATNVQIQTVKNYLVKKFDQLKDIETRITNFRSVAKDKIPTITSIEWSSISQPNNDLCFTHEQLKSLSPNHKINGDGYWNKTCGVKDENLGQKVTFNLFQLFIELCEEGDFKYTSKKLSDTLIPAALFWDSILQKVEGSITLKELQELKGNLQKCCEQILLSRSWTKSSTLAKKVYQTRYDSLVDALDVYIKIFYI